MTLEKKLTKQGNSELYEQNSLNGGEGGQEDLRRETAGKMWCEIKDEVIGRSEKVQGISGKEMSK